MKYKALIVDFDGTLVDGHWNLSLNVKEAIIKMQKKYTFSIASGRQYYGILQKRVQELTINHPLIVRGGSEIVDPKNGDVLYSQYMQNKDAREIVSFLKKHSINFFVEKGDTVYTHDGKPVEPIGPGAKFAHLNELTFSDIPKMVIIPELEPQAAAKLGEQISVLFPALHIIRVRWHTVYGFDINDAKATKHVAVLEWMKMLNLDPEEVVGVGDGHNDYPLLSACGLKVAMGNANDDLKKLADYIAPSQSEDGVANVIDKYFR